MAFGLTTLVQVPPAHADLDIVFDITNPLSTGDVRFDQVVYAPIHTAAQD